MPRDDGNAVSDAAKSDATRSAQPPQACASCRCGSRFSRSRRSLLLSRSASGRSSAAPGSSHLIDRVEQRVHAPAQPIRLGPRHGPRSLRANDEYRHVSVTGRFLNDRETLVQAVTELGAGYLGADAAAARRRHAGAGQSRLRAARAARRIDAPARQSERRGRPSPACCACTEPKAASCATTIPRTTAGIRAMSPRSRQRAASTACRAVLHRCRRRTTIRRRPVGGLTVIAFPTTTWSTR